MSIETNLASIAKSLETIATFVTSQNAQIPSSPAVAAPSGPVPAPVVQAPAAAPAPAPVPAPVPQAEAPAAPVPVQPAAVPAGVQAPFTDAKGVMAYCMTKYQQLGPVKGGLIQNVLVQLGVGNLNALQPEQYGAFYAAVEAIQ